MIDVRISEELSADSVLQTLKLASDPAIAKQSQRFFKTGPGEYGETDQFLGLRVPTLRETCRQFKNIALNQIEILLRSRFHEVRLCAIFMLVDQYKRGSQTHKQQIFNCYCTNIRQVNNWDLVDSSAYHIVGPHLEHGKRLMLVKFARSKILWERRIAIISTYHYIRNHDYDTTLNLATILLQDREDLIHKAVGWMLREIGNRDRKIEDRFLNQYAATMPRTMLRYAIEKYPAQRRQQLLNRHKIV